MMEDMIIHWKQRSRDEPFETERGGAQVQGSKFNVQSEVETLNLEH